MNSKRKRFEFNNLKQNKQGLEKLNKNYDHFLVEVTRVTSNGTLLKGFELHHIIPLVNNGSNEHSNLIWLPKAIHRMLKDKELEYNTREKVLEFAKQYIDNQKSMNIVGFNKGIEDNMFDKKEYTKQGCENNREHLKRYKQDGYENNKQHHRQGYENNKEKIKEKRNKYHKQYDKTKLGKVSKIKRASKQRFKNAKELKLKMNSLFRYQLLCSSNLEYIYGKYDEQKHKIKGLQGE